MRRLVAAADINLDEDALEVVFDGVGGDEQAFADLAVGVARRQKAEDFPLTFGQEGKRRGSGSRRGRRRKAVRVQEKLVSFGLAAIAGAQQLGSGLAQGGTLRRRQGTHGLRVPADAADHLHTLIDQRRRVLLTLCGQRGRLLMRQRLTGPIRQPLQQAQRVGSVGVWGVALRRKDAEKSGFGRGPRRTDRQVRGGYGGGVQVAEVKAARLDPLSFFQAVPDIRLFVPDDPRSWAIAQRHRERRVIDAEIVVIGKEKALLGFRVEADVECLGGSNACSHPVQSLVEPVRLSGSKAAEFAAGLQHKA